MRSETIEQFVANQIDRMTQSDKDPAAVMLGHEDWLRSCSHGAGRQVRRQDTRRMKQPLVESVWQCITLREERLIEEAPSAYKPVGPVLQAQQEAGLIRASVRLKPWLTFKA